MSLLSEQNVEIWGGIECTINRVGDYYFDQLENSGHWWREEDIQLFAGLGLKKIRYPVLWEHHQPLEHSPINWNTVESKLRKIRDTGMDVIAGLVHHGSGPVYADIREESFALGLAAYATGVAKKFPWINYYTPVNEPLTTARFCGLYGLWYPHGGNDACFCRILVNECKATVMAMAAIRMININAKLVQTDDLAKVHSTPALAYQAAFENERRWLSYDLLCGHVRSDHALWGFLTSNGIRPEELAYFCENPCPPDIVGVNYYLTSERYLDENLTAYPAHTHGGNNQHKYADVEAVRVNGAKPAGLQQLLRESWERYNIPLAVTEVHLHCTREEQMRWINESWVIANGLHAEGIPILAITPWALLGSFGWDKLLTARGGTYEPGVFDLGDGYPRPTILAAMIRAYSSCQPFFHPVLSSEGWWKRHSRVCYGIGKLVPERNLFGKLLVISGAHAPEMAHVCRQRCLNYIDQANVEVTNGLYTEKVWATILVNEYLEIQLTGQVDLVILLAGYDLYRCLNAGLDLMMDGESGTWAICTDGVLRKQISDLLPVIHYLVG